MSGLPLVSTEFFVGTDPKLDFLPNSGLGKCSFRVKAVDKVKDDNAQGGWKDGKTLWATAIVYSSKNRPFAENVYESIKKSDTIILSGKIFTRSYEDKNKNQQMVVEIDVKELGPLLHFRTTPHGAASSGRSRASSTQQDSGGTTTQTTAADPAEQQGDDGDPPF